jgi:hypothetical protein
MATASPLVRVLNSEAPADKPFGIVLVLPPSPFDADEELDSPEHLFRDVRVLWFTTADDMHVAHTAITDLADCMDDEPSIKLLDDLRGTRYTVIAPAPSDPDEEGASPEWPTIDFGPMPAIEATIVRVNHRGIDFAIRALRTDPLTDQPTTELFAVAEAHGDEWGDFGTPELYHTDALRDTFGMNVLYLARQAR